MFYAMHMDTYTVYIYGGVDGIPVNLVSILCAHNTHDTHTDEVDGRLNWKFPRTYLTTQTSKLIS